MKATIGIMGTSQINHLIPVLSEIYNVCNIQEIWDSDYGEQQKLERYKEMIKGCDVLYNIYTGNFFFDRVKLAKESNTKVISHWIGTDVYNLLRGKTSRDEISLVDRHFVCADHLKEELDSKDINAATVPIVPFSINLEIASMPKEHAAMIYMPRDKEAFYGGMTLSHIFKEFYELMFHVVANDDEVLFRDYSNVIVHGVLNQEEMEELYNKVSFVIRYTRHDGLSMSVIEGLAKGKTVIWNQNMSQTIDVHSLDEMRNAIKGILSEPPSINYEGNMFIKKTYTKEAFIEAFNREVENVFKKD